jgi:Fe-S cluster assembly protein SufD
MARFMELGFPTIADEDWRYTNVASIAGTEFAASKPVNESSLTHVIEPLRIGSDVPLLVVVNGRVSQKLSSIRLLPQGVRFGSLRHAMEQEDPAVRANLARHARHMDHSFTALNTALFEDGLFLEIAAGAIVERPVHVIHVLTRGNGPHMTNTRNLVICGANSQSTVIETYISEDAGVQFNNVVTEIVAKDSAIVDYYKVTREGDQTSHIGTFQLQQHRSSNVHVFAGTFGGGLVRHDINTVLDGEGCDCGLNGLYMVNDKQHIDNHLVVLHAQPHCDSREYFKGVLDGHGKGIFSGKIIVKPGAQKTDAKQTNSSLLLSRNAQVESKPQLEIFADDVKCTHGATIGQMNEEAIFYLQTRGIDAHTARGLLVFAFANDVLQRVKVEPLRQQLERIVIDRLPESYHVGEQG